MFYNSNRITNHIQSGGSSLHLRKPPMESLAQIFLFYRLAADQQFTPRSEPLHPPVIQNGVESRVNYNTLHLGYVPGVPEHKASTEVDTWVLHPKKPGCHVVHQVDEEGEVTHQE